jgi:hypothetical protein
MLRSALPCVLLLLAAPLAHAQDPAAIGNGHDPAFVGGRPAPMAGPPREQAPSSVAAMERATAAEEVEALLRQVRMQQDGSRDTSESDPRDVTSTLQYRTQAENLVRRNWNQLGPLSRDLYSATFERTHPDEARGVSRYNQTDANDPEARLRAGIRDAEQEMRNLESLLLPMLKDLKQATDTAIEQRARR